jgi:hypothetical protein
MGWNHILLKLATFAFIFLEVGSVNVTVVLTMCKEDGIRNQNYRMDKTLMKFSRQYNQTLTLIKSLLITWKHGHKETGFHEDDFLNLIIFTNSRASYDKLENEVFSWSKAYVYPLKLSYRPAIYPNGK